MKNKTAIDVINRYTALKLAERANAAGAEKLKNLFVDACNLLADDSDQLEIGAQLYYRYERATYVYSNAIQAKRRALESLMKKYESLNKPSKILKGWAVR